MGGATKSLSLVNTIVQVKAVIMKTIPQTNKLSATPSPPPPKALPRRMMVAIEKSPIEMPTMSITSAIVIIMY